MNTFRRRGEITTLLLLASLGVMLAGSFVGARLTARQNAVTSVTNAQSGNLGCIETDGGKNPQVGGAVIATFQDPLNNGQQRQETYKDTCQPYYGGVPILTEYYCDGVVKKQEDLPCTYQAGAGKCTTDASGFGRCEAGLPSVQVVSPGVPTPTAAYTYPPGQQHYIQSVEIVSVNRTQGTFRINGCTGTQNSGQSNAKFWVDGVVVRQPPEYADFVFNRGLPNDCETKTVTVYFNNLTDAQLCSGFGLVANFFYFKNNGTKSNPFNVPPQLQYCPATATPVPPTATVTPDTRCGQPGNPACPTPDTRCGQPGNPACPTSTPAPLSTCPYTSQAFIEGPRGVRFSQITFSSTSGGGTISFNGTPVDVGNNRQRVYFPASPATYNVPTTPITATITLNTSSLPAGYTIRNADCRDNNNVQTCQNWYSNTVIISLACNGNNLYGWQIDGPSITNTPAPQRATNTPVPAQPQQRTYQLDIRPHGTPAGSDDRSCWIVWNTQNGTVNRRGGSGVDCGGDANSSRLKVTLKLTRANQSNVAYDFQTNSCAGASNKCETYVSGGGIGSISTGGQIECTWSNMANSDQVQCRVVSTGGTQPTASNSCGGSCIYSEGGQCKQGNCLDGSNNCSTNVNCGYKPGCSTGATVACPSSMGTGRQPTATANVDVNNDGVVSVADFLQQVRSGRDINGDGRVDVRDLTAILFQLGSTVSR